MMGGTSNPVAATDEIKALCDQIRAELEEKVGRNFDTYEPILFSSQVVAGTNYFIKIHVGNEEFVHVRVFKPLPAHGTTPELHSHQVGKTRSDPLAYF